VNEKTFAYKNPKTGAMEHYDSATGELVGVHKDNISKVQTLEERAIKVELPSGGTILVDPSTRLPDERWEYSIELAQKICDEIVEGRLITDICDGQLYPPYKVVARWKRMYEKFKEMLQSAYEDRAEHIADNIRRLADETNEGNYSSKNVQIQAYKSLASYDSSRFRARPATEVSQVGSQTIVIVTGVIREGDVERDVKKIEESGP